MHFMAKNAEFLNAKSFFGAYENRLLARIKYLECRHDIQRCAGVNFGLLYRSVSERMKAAD
jgi:hypothetical protein